MHKCDWTHSTHHPKCKQQQIEKIIWKKWIDTKYVCIHTVKVYTKVNYLLKFRLHLVNQTSPFLCVLPHICKNVHGHCTQAHIHTYDQLQWSLYAFCIFILFPFINFLQLDSNLKRSASLMYIVSSKYRGSHLELVGFICRIVAMKK